MKMKWCMAGFLTLIFCASVQLRAQDTKVDPVKKFAEAKAKAEMGDAWSQYELGVYYRDGYGVPKNDVETVKFFRQAAQQGLAEAQCALGSCYEFGTDGVSKDEVEALKWFRKAADQEYAWAQDRLGICLHSGVGIAKDQVEAVKWFRKAADQNFADAQYNLGCCYREGFGLVKDMVEAVQWSWKAAEQGLAVAQYDQAIYYGQGEGVPQDFVQACKWDILAAGQGNPDALKNLQIVEGLMTAKQISEAQELARRFTPSKDGSANFVSPENQTASGSGFLITDDGYLISNYHVVKAATKVRLVTSVGTIDAKVVQVDAVNDLALLKADGRFAPLPILPSRTAHLGGTVATIGFPDPSLQGFSPKLAKGEIASLSGAGDDPRYFQISVPVQPGNSGGALVDERGNVIGIVSAKLDAAVALAASGALPENVNYAVKSSLLLSFLESVPDVASKLKEPNTKDEPFQDVVKSAQGAAVLVLVY